MQDLLDKVNDFIDKIPNVVVGIIYLLIALLLGLLVKAIFVGIVKRTKLGKKLNKLGEKTENEGDKATGTQAIQIVGKLLFLIVFLLFLPAALDKFGMTNVAEPITGLVDTFLTYIPNIVACVVILLVGFFIANIVRQILVTAINASKVEKLQDKFGKGKSKVNIAKIIGTIAYVLIVVVVLICALNILGIKAISDPATSMLDTIINAVPSILVAVIMLLVGFFLANLVDSLLSALFENTSIDDKINKWLSGDNKEVKTFSFSKLIIGIVKTIIVVIFAIEAVKTLNLGMLSDIGTAVISYIPKAIVAIAVILIAYVVDRLLDTKLKLSPIATKIVRVVVYILAAFIALSQLNIAPEIINTTYKLVIAGIAIAFAIAVGVGGIDFIKKFLSNVKVEKKDDQAVEKKDDQNK